MKARVTAPGVIVKTRPRGGRPARCCRRASRAHGVSGTSREVPFLVSSRRTMPCRRSTCSRRMPQSSPRRIAISAASVTMTGSSAERVDLTIQSSSLRGHSDSGTPRSLMRVITRRSRASSTVGRRTSCTGLARSGQPQSLRATVYTWESMASLRTTVAGALSCSHSSRMAMRSVLRIRSIGRPAMRVDSQVRAMDCSAVAPFFKTDTSVR
ncbi:hypothetical protein PNO31109_01250 [Pandoraea nosoerga]|uniref:Uncharacterized protein n=1 Tax=Pandoraea nosoerga TaxID=2508296 RepID=A0A5E4T916_9BURK|nr:hypothetical protein PNO31109_01250 [Pandoraea nosoerga]